MSLDGFQNTCPNSPSRALGKGRLLMKRVLICPAERPPVRLLAHSVPLVQAPMLGQSLVEYWLTHLACEKVKELHLLANDRPELVRALVGDGARWGLKVEVLGESRAGETERRDREYY